MLWENRENAGFTAPGVKTWLPLVWGWPALTVETETADAGTTLKLYRELLKLRRTWPALHAGSVGEVYEGNGVLHYVRTLGSERLQVHLNLTGSPQWSPSLEGQVLVASGLDRAGEAVRTGLELRGNEALVVEVS